MKVKEVRKELIKIYGLNCFMDDLWIPREKEIITIHHIVERRNGGHTNINNCALLSNNAHQYLNLLDYNYHYTYEELNYLFRFLLSTKKPPNAEYYDEIRHVLRYKK